MIHRKQNSTQLERHLHWRSTATDAAIFCVLRRNVYNVDVPLIELSSLKTKDKFEVD